MFPRPIIDPEISTLAPNFRAVSLFVDAHGVVTIPLGPAVLADACRVVQEGGPTWAEAHLSSWSDVYSAFGAKPNRTPCSAQALRKRVLKDGALPAINPVVDLYNAVSLRFAVPVGGENIDAYVGPLGSRLRMAPSSSTRSPMERLRSSILPPERLSGVMTPG